MNYLGDAIAWVLAHLGGPGGVGERMLEHLWYTLAAMAIAALIAVPLGLAIGHTGRGRSVVTAAGAARALPTLGVVTLAALAMGIGLAAPMVALVLLAIPPILAGAYAGVDAIDPVTRDAAEAVGMSGWQRVALVEVPLGMPLLLGGLRSATLQVVSTATLAAYVGGGGLGRFLFLGLKTQDYPQMLASALLVVLLALGLDLGLDLAQRVARRAASPTIPRRKGLS